MTRFKPTHRITLDDGVEDVMLVHNEGDGSVAGPAYTREEWRASARADYEKNEYGEWLFKGQPFAGNVERLSRTRGTSRLKRPPAVTRAAWYSRVSKADLYDAACYMGASLAGDCDNPDKGIERVVEELRCLALNGIIPARVGRAVRG